MSLILSRKPSKKHDVRTNSSDNWEGNILDALGIKFENGDYYMRGFIEDSTRLSDESLELYAEEAWGVTDFRKTLKEKFPEITVYFTTEEEDNGVFETNDKDCKYFHDRYFVSIDMDPIYDYDYFTKKEDALEYISRMTNGRVKTEDDIDRFNEDEYENNKSVNLYEYKIVD